MNNSNGKTRRLAGLALFTAIVVVLQLLGSFIKVGPFAVSLVLIPIVVGAAVYGVSAGAWLGFVFGVVVTIAVVTGADQGGDHRHSDGLHAHHPQTAQQNRQRQRQLHVPEALRAAHPHRRGALKHIARYLL